MIPPGTRVVIPHRGLRAGKSRLAPILGAGDRFLLGQHMLRSVVAASRAVAADVVVLSPDPSMAALAADLGAAFELQDGTGLNEGLEQARRRAITDQIAVLAVINADLPELAPDDVAALIEALPPGPASVAIAPDYTGSGTNGLVQRPPRAIGFRFGAGSLAAHLADARRRGLAHALVRRPALAADIDTPDDYLEWRARRARAAGRYRGSRSDGDRRQVEAPGVITTGFGAK